MFEIIKSTNLTRNPEISMRKKIILCFIITGFLVITLSLTTYMAISYSSKLHKLRERIAENSLIVKPDDHIGSRPNYIFKSKIIEWKDLTPHLEEIYGNDVEKKIVGTFPTPNSFNGTDITNILSDDEKIYFPSYGAFALHTTVGFFKILLIDPNTSEYNKILSIASFVSGNTVHSLAGARRICPIYGGAIYPERLLKTFFASAQPLKQHCGYIARFLSFILSQQGYGTQLIQLQTADQKNGHVVMQVFMPEMNKFAMIDPDYGTIVVGGGLLNYLVYTRNSNYGASKTEFYANKGYLQ